MPHSRLAAAPVTLVELTAWLPAILSDLARSRDLAASAPTNTNIRRQLQRAVMCEFCAHFRHEEPLADGRVGLFVLGYMGDVAGYLNQAYDLIHSTDFEWIIAQGFDSGERKANAHA